MADEQCTSGAGPAVGDDGGSGEVAAEAVAGAEGEVEVWATGVEPPPHAAAATPSPARRAASLARTG